MILPRAFLFLVGFVTFFTFGCGDDTTDVPDAVDSGADAGFPEGPAGEILRVEETRNHVVPALSGEVQVVRTESDVPHIYAANARDLYIVQGFVVARDRYFEFELGRRLGLGKVAELLGEAGLSLDQLSRGQGFTQIADRILTLLTDEQRSMFEAFAIGVNAYIEAVRTREVFPPAELRLASILFGLSSPTELMEDVGARDVAGFMAVPVFQLGFDTNDVLRSAIRDQLNEAFEGEIDAEARRAAVFEDILNRVAPTHPVASAPGFGLAGDLSSIGSLRLPRARTPHVRPRPGTNLRPEREMLSRLVRRGDQVEHWLHGGRGADFGSNVWAVSGDRTESGDAILAGDGHLSLGVPTLFFQMGLDTKVFAAAETENPLTVFGLFFPGVPVMAVGTNGRVAWSQTYQRADVTDWYAEEVVLGGDGLPTGTMFQGDERPLEKIDETYVVADVPALESVGRTEMWARYVTQDGRLLASIEGRAVLAEDLPSETGPVVNMQGDYVVPGDENGDGVVSAVSFDFTGFDLSNLVSTLEGFTHANNISEFREATRGSVAYSQNLGAADIHGNILYGGYHAMPCRTHLARNPDGTWADGADPTSLIDGTEYGGFEIPLTDGGMPDESQGADPSKCIIPFDRWPTSANPASGFVFNANNDIASVSFDDSLTDDEYYLGGPWVPGQRAETIQRRLTEEVASGDVTVDEMAKLQGNHESRIAERIAPFLMRAIMQGRTLSEKDGPLDPAETRLRDLYVASSERFDEVLARLTEWQGRGYQAESGVETFYHAPSAEQKRDAVSTMIFNQWFRDFFNAVFADEGVDFIWDIDPRVLRIGGLLRLIAGRGPDNPQALTSYDEATEESRFFDDRETSEVELSDEVALGALLSTLSRLEEDAAEPGIGGFGTPNMDEWLWGLRHQVKFESLLSTFAGDNETVALLADGFSIDTERLPLMSGLEETDPRSGLRWFPRAGDLNNVDAGNWSFNTPDYFYGSGPVMRMVITLSPDAVSGRNILPQGQNGRPETDYFDDQAEAWLANETLPMRFEVADVVAGAVGRERFSPTP